MTNRITIYNIPDELMSKLKSYARARGLTLSSAVKSILSEYLSDENSGGVR